MPDTARAVQQAGVMHGWLVTSGPAARVHNDGRARRERVVACAPAAPRAFHVEAWVGAGRIVAEVCGTVRRKTVQPLLQHHPNGCAVTRTADGYGYVVDLTECQSCESVVKFVGAANTEQRFADGHERHQTGWSEFTLAHVAVEITDVRAAGDQ